jgi:Zn-finger nucleic acid-binding protein
MKCSNCGALMPQGMVICPWCNTDSSIVESRADLREVNEFTTRAPDSPRQCPSCVAPLQTINIATQGRYLVEICGQCRGLFFDNNELETIMFTLVSNDFRIDYARLLHIESVARPPALPAGNIPCPVCQAPMTIKAVAGNAVPPLAACARHGLWLQAGVLPQLIEWKKAAGALPAAPAAVDAAERRSLRNCFSCGAPLAPGNPVCTSCQVRQPLDLSLLGDITVLQAETAKNCPDCSTPLRQASVSIPEAYTLEFCPACYGMALETSRLEAMLDSMVRYVFHADLEFIAARARAHPLSREFHYRPCPGCQVLMNRRNAGMLSAVVLDSCKPCQLTWLDDGKLQELCAWRKGGGKLLDAQRKAALQTGEQEQKLREQIRVVESRLLGGGEVQRLFGAGALGEQADRMLLRTLQSELEALLSKGG